MTLRGSKVGQTSWKGFEIGLSYLKGILILENLWRFKRVFPYNQDQGHSEGDAFGGSSLTEIYNCTLERCIS